MKAVPMRVHSTKFEGVTEKDQFHGTICLPPPGGLTREKDGGASCTLYLLGVKGHFLYLLWCSGGR